MKKIAFLILIFVFTFGNVYADEDIKLVFDNQELTVTTAPIKVCGTVMVPLRPIFEKLGMEIEWDAMRGVVTTTSKIGEIKMRVGSNIVSVNSHSVIILPTYIRIINGSTMVPLSFISDTTGTQVNWIDGTNVIDIIAD